MLPALAIPSTEAARDSERREAADAERHRDAGRADEAVGQVRVGRIGDIERRRGDERVDLLQRPRLLPRQRGAPAQGLEVILGADQRAGEYPVAQDAAEILRPGFQIMLMDRV